MLRTLTITLSAGIFFAGCGIPGDTPLLDLTADDAQLICDHVDYDGEDQVEECENGATYPSVDDGGTEGQVTIPASTHDDCMDYFEAVRDADNPDCVAVFDDWKDCKSEDDWDNETVCGVYAGEMEAPVSDVCMEVGLCATPPAE